ncbi:MAG TPA: hypothetical protein DIW52_15940 [Pseudomonas sp.]|nr:hypothetical protein [Pseudomonas sp.]
MTLVIDGVLLLGGVGNVIQSSANLVGASLLAKAACQSTLMSPDMPSSRAGSLPQWIAFH